MNYQWDPKEYERSSTAQAGWARELLDGLQFRGDEAVLDIGCGDGKITALLLERVPKGRVAGIDSSPAMIGLASERYGTLPRLTLEVVDARELPFDSEFDVVFSNSALHWIRDHRPVLNGIRRALVPGGRAHLRFGGKGATKEVTAILREMMAKPEWAAYFADFESPYGFFDAAEYQPWVEEAGLIPERVELLPRMMSHDAPSFAAWVRTTKMPYTQRVPEPKRDAFVDSVVSEYARRHPPDAEGRLSVTMNRLDVVARRPL